MNKLITLLALCCAASAGDFQTSTNELGEVTLTVYSPSTLQPVVCIPPYVDEICPWAFQNRLEVQTVHIPDKTRHIGTGAFYGCSNMRHVRLSPGTKAIGPLAFSRCVALESVIVPPDCQLGDRVFEGCYSLGAWKPWITYRPEGKTLAIIWEGNLQTSTNLVDWTDLQSSEGIMTEQTSSDASFFRAATPPHKESLSHWAPVGSDCQR
ncbi:MAG: leucine-rich repeat domain-containing protein, partial [Verrucomicrobia bacterium]|nr:leucine-rich repeat domain-containing protein [Verrucomicrobiota bacterium]